MMQGTQYDRPSDAAVSMARKVLGGTLGKVKDRLDVTPTKRVLPLSMTGGGGESPPPGDGGRRTPPNLDLTDGGPMLLTTTVGPHSITTVTTRQPTATSDPAVATAMRAHLTAAATTLGRRLPGAAFGVTDGAVGRADRQLDRLAHLSGTSTFYGGLYKKAYSDALQHHLDAETLALEAQQPTPSPARPKTAPSSFASDLPRSARAPPPQRAHRFVDSKRWVPPAPAAEQRDGRDGGGSGTGWTPTFRRAASTDLSVSLASAGYRPEWSRGFRGVGEAGGRRPRQESTWRSQSNRPATAPAGVRRLGSSVTGRGPVQARRQHRTHREPVARAPFDDSFSEAHVARDVRDVLHAQGGSPYMFHPHDVRDDLFLGKGSDAERAMYEGPRGAPDPDDVMVEQLTEEAVSKVVDKVVKKILAK